MRGVREIYSSSINVEPLHIMINHKTSNDSWEADLKPGEPFMVLALHFSAFSVSSFIF